MKLKREPACILQTVCQENFAQKFFVYVVALARLEDAPTFVLNGVVSKRPKLTKMKPYFRVESKTCLKVLTSGVKHLP